MKKKILIIKDEFQFDRSLKALLFPSSSGLAFVAPSYLRLQAEEPPFNIFVRLYRKIIVFVRLLKSSLP